MYSPFLFVFVVMGLAPLSVFSIWIVAASTGWSLSSVTLPLIWPLCANAGAVTNARPRARIDVATARRMMAPVMESSSVQVGGSTDPPVILLLLDRPSGDVRDQ